MIAGQQFTGGAVTAFTKQGGTIVQKVPVPSGTADFSPIISATMKADCVFFFFTPVLSQRFVTQYFATGLTMPLLVPGCSVLAPPVLQSLGDKSVGIWGSHVYTDLLDTDINKTYVNNFVKKYNMIPTAISLSADIGLNIYLEAVKTTGGDTTFAKIMDALHKNKVVTPAGTFSFTPEGLGIGDMYILKVIKTPDGRYDFSVIDKYPQMPIDMPR
jgi:branched-chain amino acid transport system substrate-binding protein